MAQHALAEGSVQGGLLGRGLEPSPHGAVQLLLIDLGPGASLTPGPHVSFLCLLQYPLAALTSSVESVLQEECWMD